MKIETTPLKAKMLLTFLKNREVRQIAIDHFALNELEELVTALERAARVEPHAMAPALAPEPDPQKRKPK